MSALQKKIGKKFIITTEVKPPRGPDTTGFQEEIGQIKSNKKITAVNVIDSPSARLFMSSLGASILLKQGGLEPIFQMVCRDRNMLALESDLISAQAFGITDILALTGDHPGRGKSDHPRVKPVYDLDSTSLLKTISLMNCGETPAGVKLNKKTSFFPGAAISPQVNPALPEILKTKRKIQAGARFFQTQAVFDTQKLGEFLDLTDENIQDIRKNIIVGVIPLTSERMIKFLNNLPGIRIPKPMSKKIIESENPEETGVNIAINTIDEIRKMGVGGVHIMPVGKTQTLHKILDKH
jgi:methylenetetrahydrofolate reductase (NADPH)